jgi:hypothetical protein
LARARVIGPCICVAVGTAVVSRVGMSSSLSLYKDLMGYFIVVD